MLYNSSVDTEYVSLDIQQMMEDPKFGKCVSRSSDDACTICMCDLPNDTSQYQVRCPKDTCSYSLCHCCLKRVFSFKYVRFYNCFICNAEYQLKNAEQIFKDRLASLDDVNLRPSFEELIQDLPNQFKPETIRRKKQQQREISALKGMQVTITACIMDPNMSEKAAEELARRIPSIEEVFEGEINESDAVEEADPQLSSTCAPVSIMSKQTNQQKNKQKYVHL